MSRINWFVSCPHCECGEVEAELTVEGEILDCTEVYCSDCGLPGTVKVIDSEALDLTWDEFV